MCGDNLWQSGREENDQRPKPNDQTMMSGIGVAIGQWDLGFGHCPTPVKRGNS